MPFYKEIKRCLGFLPYPYKENMCIWYSNKLYDDWWNSLTDEQRSRIEQKRKERKERDRIKARNAMMKLALSSSLISNLYSKNNMNNHYLREDQDYEY